MKNSIGVLLRGSVWTLLAFGLSSGIRFLTSVALAKILAPQLFGLMLIVYTLRTGIELFSDVGIGQNIVYSKNGEDPEFYNTAWTIQIIRSVVIWAMLSAIAWPVSVFYKEPQLFYLFPITALSSVLGGFNAVSTHLLQKKMQLGKLNQFEIITQLLSGIVGVSIAYVYPNIWSMVAGSVIAGLIYMVGSFFLMPNIKHKIYISKIHYAEILSFGKWIFFSSIVFFLSVNYDRLYFAKIVPLELLGIYGIARNIADLVGTLVARLGYNVVFPFIVSHSQTPRAELRAQLAKPRAFFLCFVAAGTAVLASTADILIRILYDQRYAAAAWMLPVLIVGSWLSVLARVNESTLLGVGKPSYVAASNAIKFAFLIVGLPLSVALSGLLGGVLVVAAVDISRYAPILIGQRREHMSYARQDVAITLAMFALMGVLEFVRWSVGLGTSFDSLPAFGLPSIAG